MLSPHTRTVAMDLIRPPPGLRLDLAVLTTYTLDLETVLALPLAVMAHSDSGIDKLLEDPLLLLQALREAGDRIHIFVDETGIAVPRRARELYATLEKSIHPVLAPGGGVFHPKVWLSRFVADDTETAAVLRVAVLSRNLTFDRSWDIALASEATSGQRRVAGSGPLGRLIAHLPQLCKTSLGLGLVDRIEGLSRETARTAFPAPEGFFDEPISFHTIGLPRNKRWAPNVPNGSKVLAVAPFVSPTILEKARALGTGKGWLIARHEELEVVSEAVVAQWDEVLVVSDAASDEVDDESSSRLSGLHAKIVGVEHGWDATWFIGSANLTDAAWNGRNVEVMASMTGRKKRVGILPFLDEFHDLCETYRSSPEAPFEEGEVGEADRVLKFVVRAIVDADFRITCAPADDLWEWRLEGQIALPDGVVVRVWPVSVVEEHAVKLVPPVSLTLPMSRLTAFVAFRLTVDSPDAEDKCFALKLPIGGVPPERTAHILRSLIDSPERFLEFLRALLGGLDGLSEMIEGMGDPKGAAWWSGIEAETLLEDLLRATSRNPERLETVRELIADLRRTEEGRRIVPDRLYTVWQAVEETLGTTRSPQ